MKISVVGAGAVGGYFGGRLIQAGRDVTFLVRLNRAEELQAQGLRILSPLHGDFTVRPKTMTAAQIASPYDVVFLSVKSYSLAGAINDARISRGRDQMGAHAQLFARHGSLEARIGESFSQERADNTRLFQRVALFLCACLDPVRLPITHGPLANIGPIAVRR